MGPPGQSPENIHQVVDTVVVGKFTEIAIRIDNVRNAVFGNKLELTNGILLMFYQMFIISRKVWRLQ